MSQHADAVAVLTRWPAPTARQETLRHRFLAHLAAYDDALDRSCHPAHLTASTVILSADRREVLLTLHTKAGRWFQLGGHVEAGDRTLLDAARREATEESGLSGLTWAPEPVHLDAHEVGFCHPFGPVDHLDVRFLAVAPSGAAPLVSAESDDVRWWPVDALPTDEPSMAELLGFALSG